MDKKRTKKEKSLSRPCPECGDGKLSKVMKQMKRNGVIYSEEFVECSDCGYSEKFRLSKKAKREALVMNGEILVRKNPPMRR